TGAYPFWGRDEWDLMREIAQEEPRAPHERNRRVPQALGELCLRLLEKEPRERLASAGAVGDALEALLAEADASWDTPLCYGWDAAGRTTRPEPALQVPGEPPRVNFHHRRGPKPPSAEAPPKRPGRTVARGRPLRVGAACGALLASLGSGYLLLAREPPPDTEPPTTPAPAGPILASLLRATFPGEGRTSEACFVREVAPPWMPPEAGAGAAPERADTPAPVVEVTAHRKGETRLKKKEHKAPERKGIGSNLARWCVGATAVANAACAGSAAQVRPMPEPRACPSEVINNVISRFRIPVGEESSGLILPVFDPRSGKREPVPVQAGPIHVELLAPWSKLPEGTFLFGHLVFGPERVYGRFTQARLPDGEMVPVCFALVPTSGRQQGLPIEGTVEPGTVKVFPIGRVMSVESFE
ncbi:MAG TPA: hypothetical protein VLQ93_06280, partial [Myxococcaceae bacterium]|nr:hypothetical protein [Myxococcaceae bacterium]